MFKRPFIASLGIFALGIGYAFYRFQEASPEDHKAYALLIEDSAGNEQTTSSHKIKQKRSEVSKDLHLAKNGQRLHLHLEGEEADLHLEKDGDQVVIIERLSPVTCALQERLYPEISQQSVVWFDAAQAQLNYRNHELFAENVELKRFLIPGTTLPHAIPGTVPMMEGFAKTMNLSVEGKDPIMTAAYFKGSMQLLYRNEPANINVEADQASYSDGILLLEGSVKAQHPIGSVKAQIVEFRPDTVDGKKSYSKAFIEKDVDITLSHGGKVRCDKAVIDDHIKKAIFTSPHEVVYLDNFTDRKGINSPLLLKCSKVEIDLLPDLKGSKPKLGHLNAFGNVHVIYNNDTTLTADEADYSFKPDPIKQNHLISGLITLKATQDEDGLCRLTNLQGDYIRAEIIVFNTLDATAILSQPYGSFQTVREGKTSAPLSFSANKLVWQQNQDLMRLEKNAIVTDSQYGTLSTDDTLTIIRSTAPDGKKQLKSILSNGRTILTHAEEEKGLTHTLVCNGTTFLDHQLYTVDFTSKPNGEQVSFEDEYGTIKADRAKLTYRLVKDRIVPQMLTLDGNLHILNRYTSTEDYPTGNQLQYALANNAEYNFLSKEINLHSGKQCPRVLLFDKANHFEVSAPGLKIKRNEVTGKDSISGQGDVRFNLVEHELQQIKNHFRFES